MHNTMMFFTDRGRCYWLKVYDIPEGTKQNKGRAIQNMLQIEPGDKVQACLLIRKLQDPDFCQSHYVVFATKDGIVKKTCLTEYSRPRTNGVNAINIREEDRVIAVNLTNGTDEIIVANRNGRAVRFNETDVRTMGRVSTGVQSIVLDDDGADEVIGMAVINDPENESILVMSDKGWGKYTSVEAYRKTNRHAKGVKAMNLPEDSKLVTLQVVTEEDDLMIINKSGTVIRLHVDDIKETKNRATQGTKVIELKKRGDSIAHVCVVPRAEDEENGTSENEETPNIEEGSASEE
jgi:DNA gyrase subunit A